MRMNRQRTWMGPVGAALVLLLSACHDDPAGLGDSQGSPRQEAVVSAPTFRQALQMQTVARAVALSLGDPELRQTLLEDLRDSPFPQHRIHLRGYLVGGPVGQRVGEILGLESGGIASLLAGLPDLEISMPIPLDRARWTGSADIVVVGTAGTISSAAAELVMRGFNVAGEPVEFSAFRQQRFPSIAIARSEVAFGSNPEEVRRSAPKQSRPTVSTREEEFPVTTLGDENPLLR